MFGLLDHFNIGKSWVCHMVEISAPISDYDVFLLIWTPASSVGVFFLLSKNQSRVGLWIERKVIKTKVCLCLKYTAFSYILLK